ncbi:hypothetical protein NEUTE2DRAFT_132900 [Neurospora tetrasperma FGSC 2509]|nr:hypothetical protein NEUTE2DRAFT_132900 [Neurospora tetrasperma FGSC 2509]
MFPLLSPNQLRQRTIQDSKKNIITTQSYLEPVLHYLHPRSKMPEKKLTPNFTVRRMTAPDPNKKKDEDNKQQDKKEKDQKKDQKK